MAQNPDPTITPTETNGEDMMNRFAGITPDSAIGQLRAQRPDVVRHTQGSYEALLEPDDPAGVSCYEREMVALRVAVLTPNPTVAAWHRARLRDLGTSDEALAAIEQFPDGATLSPREQAILGHTDLLTREPGVSAPTHIAALKVAGLSPRDIVTISQLIAFLSFEVRTLVGLRLLAEEAGT